MQIGSWLATIVLFSGMLFSTARAADEILPTLVLTNDDTEIRASCIIQIPSGTVIEDRNTNGVIRIMEDGIRVRFASGSILRGATNGAPWNLLRGVGIRIDGHKNVVIENAKVHGFKNGLVASAADGLVVSDGDFSDNYRQRLKSDRQKESDDDWLYPHHNGQQKWRDEYGGAICIENSNNVIVRRIKVRRGQNGILLDRVENSSIYDNDCSFLSGWGIALWRSSHNKIQRNAFDFCIRGHVEGVYNRGQDSAGILCFEQSNENLFAENSATHGGDGFFGFAGHDAIGQTWWDAEKERLRQQLKREPKDSEIQPPPELVRVLSAKGCNGNILIDNDFSYAAAHGIELTFSEDNKIIRNRVVENGICGFWGGYSSNTLIAENDFQRNGGMSYSLERGAINMEHAADNSILKNNFLNNKCAIHLWWDDDGVLMKFPGVAGNEKGVTGNVIAGNHFEINNNIDFKRLGDRTRLVILQLRNSGKPQVHDNFYGKNDVTLRHPLAREFALQDGCELTDLAKTPKYDVPKYAPLGATRPVGNRRDLRSRAWIQMNEWGPQEP